MQAVVPTTISLSATLRTHFGLSTRQLARYLGVTAGFVGHLETGRKGLPPALAPRLLHLIRLLPPPLGQGPPAAPEPALYHPLQPLPQPECLEPVTAPAEAGALVPELLRRRLRDCRLQLLSRGQQLARLQARAQALSRRHRGLAQLQVAPAPPEPKEAAHYARWLGELATDLAQADPNPAAAAAARQVLAARVAGLRAEVAALTAALPPE